MSFEEALRQKILFVKRYLNVAWRKTDKGSFITSEGNVYDFNFEKVLCTKDIIPELEKILISEKPSKTLDKELVLKAFNLMEHINRNSEMLLSPLADDAGQDTLFAYYNDKLIPLATAGDETGSVDCNEVNQILNILHEVDFYTWTLSDRMLSIEQIKQSRFGIDKKLKIFEEDFF
ncbi:hypothetical protein M9Y10_033289 [Tritrichomonas musculus]|uniref:Uncharacterized protein n=1 Tax=Tritrichomonas musculus TaxID=1915356 RepID=A0ABR2KCI5_9EUKA